jgi:hypothetical protein
LLTFLSIKSSSFWSALNCTDSVCTFIDPDLKVKQNNMFLELP